MSKEEAATGEETQGAEAEAAAEAEAEAGAEAGAENEGKIPQERLDREVGRRKELEERLAERDGELEGTKARLNELEEAATAAIPVHPDYLTREERTLVVRANELEAEEVRLESADEGFEDDPKLNTPAKVRARKVAIRQELDRIAWKANAAFERAKTQQLADLKAGREARMAREKAKKAGAKPEKEQERPGGSVVTRGAGGPGGEARPPKKGPSEEEFRKAGGTKDAAARELAKMVPD